MANKTDTYALHAKGTDPQHLLDPPTRHAIHLSRYWNETCFGLSLADLVPLAARLTHISTTTHPPSPFLCLLLKLLQLYPDLPVISHFLTQPDFKYPRILAAFYIRLTQPPLTVYTLLEPLLSDFRKLVVKPSATTPYQLTYVDSLIDDLLRNHLVLGITLPRLPPRHVLAEAFPDKLPPRDMSFLQSI